MSECLCRNVFREKGSTSIICQRHISHYLLCRAIPLAKRGREFLLYSGYSRCAVPRSGVFLSLSVLLILCCHRAHTLTGRLAATKRISRPARPQTRACRGHVMLQPMLSRGSKLGLLAAADGERGL